MAFKVHRPSGYLIKLPAFDQCKHYRNHDSLFSASKKRPFVSGNNLPFLWNIGTPQKKNVRVRDGPLAQSELPLCSKTRLKHLLCPSTVGIMTQWPQALTWALTSRHFQNNQRARNTAEEGECGPQELMTPWKCNKEFTCLTRLYCNSLYIWLTTQSLSILQCYAPFFFMKVAPL